VSTRVPLVIAALLAVFAFAPVRATEPARLPGAEVTVEQARACAAAGGYIQLSGFNAIPLCVTPYADAGRRCETDEDCQGACMAEPADQSDRPGALVGRCQANTNPFGCHQFWNHGPVGERLCMD
jgi:hypothetical protein